MYQDIAVARGPTYDTLNARMDKCQQNIETMGDDIVRLQGNLAEEEMKLEFIKEVGFTHMRVLDGLDSLLEAEGLQGVQYARGPLW